MSRAKIVGCFGVLIIASWMIPAAVVAQTTGIAGIVKDTSGAVLPGVTVEAASPALIEKTRSAVTDGQGLYSIIDLRPGTYSVTFTLTGFSSVKHEGIELTGSFTATVNADLQVGTVSETLTVSGQTPLVDTRNGVQQRVLTDEVREQLPNGRSIVFMALTIPGISNTSSGGTSGQDVVGTSDSRGSSMIHGSRSSDSRTELDGASLNNTATQANPGEVQEYVYEVGGISAETSQGGVRRNMIPKEGGNRFTGDFFAAGSSGRLQSNNLTQKLIDLKVPTPNKMIYNRDFNASVGGPILRDKLWFFSSYRHFGQNDELIGMYRAIDPNSLVFDPGLGAAGNVDLSRPAYNEAKNNFYNNRLTWQATPKNKFAFYFSEQPRKSLGQFATGTRSMEASRTQDWYRNEIAQASWKAPLTSKILIEANGTNSFMVGHLTAFPGPSDRIAIIDSGTGYTYRSSSTFYSDPNRHHTGAVQGAISYATGSHVAKFGVVSEWQSNVRGNEQVNQHMTFTLKNGSPTGITIYNGPYTAQPLAHRFGIFAQDRFTLKRLTVNAGLRFDNNTGKVHDTQTSGPNPFAPLQHWPGLENVPNWKDVSPRLGVVYDLFATGKTALKWTVGRYVVEDGQSFIDAVNPIFFNLSANRPWTDTRVCAGGIPNDFVPQDCELGSLSNPAFATGATTTHVDDAIREGWGVRQNNWETSASVQHQLLQQLALNFTYTRRWFHNFTVTDNKALVSADYDEFCIAAPTDSRLGDVSGTRICGLYDLNPAKRSVTPDNLRTDAKNYGTQKEHYEGIDLLLSARVPGRATVQGGLNYGPTENNTEACFVVDSPGVLRFCKANRPWKPDVRFVGSVELPWDINTGVSFQSLPGAPILATYNVTNADITSGKVQFVNPARTTFGSGSANVALLAPGALYNDRQYQVDIRFAKAFRYRGLRIKATVDIGNIINAGTVTVQNNAYGTAWLRPMNIFPARVVKPGVQVEF